MQNILNPWNLSCICYPNVWVMYIQGPPGTGKTFLTSRIIQSLLNVQKLQTPIVVMAYKNRVLDQLVSMCTTFCGDGEIIRLGHLSEDYQQDERLQACLMPQKGNTDVEVQCLHKRYCLTFIVCLRYEISVSLHVAHPTSTEIVATCKLNIILVLCKP